MSLKTTQAQPQIKISNRVLMFLKFETATFRLFHTILQEKLIRVTKGAFGCFFPPKTKALPTRNEIQVPVWSR